MIPSSLFFVEKHVFRLRWKSCQGAFSCFRIIAVLLAALLIASDISPAAAQESGGLGGLLRRLFRAGETEPPPAENYKPRIRTPVIRSTTPQPQQQPEEQPVPDKLDNARVVLVIGDFMASGLADGLEKAFELSPGVTILDQANGSSGLVRDDYYDWPGALGPMIEEYKPAVLAVMIGANDRQQLKFDGRRETVRSDAWTTEYKRRANQIARIAAEKNIPLVWVGMVPFPSTRVSADILSFNDIYKAAAESVNGTFVDVWDGFVDENGTFMMSGPDINGQTARLRTGDGTILSKAGRRLVAFYAEKPLRKLLGDATSPDIGVLGPENLPALRLDPFARAGNVQRTNPIAITDPDLDGGEQLLGASGPPLQLGPRTPVEKLSIEGIAAKAPAGRADNFSTGNDVTEGDSVPGTEKTTAIK
jgi:hypothetical protein